MLPQKHFLYGLFVCILLYLFFPRFGVLNLVIFLIATVLIDVDHYLYYAYRKRDWNLINAVRWFLENGKILKKIDKKNRKEFYTGFCFLHGIEILILLGTLGYFISSIFYFICMGFGFHLILDYIQLAWNKNRFDKFSIIYDYFKYGKLKFVEEAEGFIR